jgi:hypothetical protein
VKNPTVYARIHPLYYLKLNEKFNQIREETQVVVQKEQEEEEEARKQL